MNDNSAASHDLVVARPHMGRVTGGGGAGPALASTEKRGTSRELMSSGMPRSRLKDLEKESGLARAEELLEVLEPWRD